MKIRLTQDAHIEGYSGAEYRLHTDDGKPSIYVIRDNWYEATATDENGNAYRIVWRVREDFDVNENPDESDACDWDAPAEINSIETGKPVKAEIEW